MNYYTGFPLYPYSQAPECFADISHIVLTTPPVSRDIFTPVCRWGSRGTEQLYLAMREAGDKGERQVPLSPFHPGCNAISLIWGFHQTGAGAWQRVGTAACCIPHNAGSVFLGFCTRAQGRCCCREMSQEPWVITRDVFSITWGTNLPTSKNNRPTDCISVNQMVCDWWGFFSSLA